MLSTRFTTALSVATELHVYQERKGKEEPYVAHLLGVTSLVLENGGTEDEAIAALLHDTLEDQGYRFAGGADALRAYIQDRFGQRVLEIVEACTDADVQPKPPWKERKVDYLEHLKTADASVLLVSCADKLHNGRSILQDYRQIGEALWSRFRGGKEGTLWYYRSLVNAFLENPESPPYLAAELERTITEIERLAT
ncbi:MAG: bifunctional (p)ppGpp synthetase/guanosine-3',5'-bis(diphosphate) 3'-pyrophosphohydrolase [Anaerolineae bacterium]|nr:bifunctional (p)ppGpp synthetase/guanosine-3',5'-bis(diphosphate) 3'-pyrophosphohydrolase [Anaerolineae bacterium]